eukprot:scaffold2325_cov257-Pinguiococcus_pyrenoidosus.AAC.8
MVSVSGQPGWSPIRRYREADVPFRGEVGVVPRSALHIAVNHPAEVAQALLLVTSLRLQRRQRRRVLAQGLHNTGAAQRLLDGQRIGPGQPPLHGIAREAAGVEALGATPAPQEAPLVHGPRTEA